MSSPKTNSPEKKVIEIPSTPESPNTPDLSDDEFLNLNKKLEEFEKELKETAAIQSRPSSMSIARFRIPPMLENYIVELNRFTIAMINLLFFIAFVTSIILVFLCPAIFLANNNELSSSITRAQGFLGIFLQNLQSNALKNITVVPAGTACSKGIKKILYQWPGTYLSCSCATQLSIGSCFTGGDSTCYNVFPIPEKNTTVWRGVEFCVEEVIQNQDFYRIMNTSEACQAGYTMCYNSFCFKDMCPITGITLSDVPSPGAETSTAIDMGFINTYRNASSAPVIDLKVSFYEMPCFDPTQLPLDNEQGSDFPIYRRTANGCDQNERMPYSKEVSSSLVSEYIAWNGLNAAFNLPRFNSTIDYSTYLYTENFLGINTTLGCQLPNPDLIIDFQRVDMWEPRIFGILSICLISAYFIYTNYMGIEFKKRLLGIIFKYLMRVSIVTFTINYMIIIAEQWMPDFDRVRNLKADIAPLRYNGCFLEIGVKLKMKDFYDEAWSNSNYIDRYMMIFFACTMILYVISILPALYILLEKIAHQFRIR